MHELLLWSTCPSMSRRKAVQAYRLPQLLQRPQLKAENLKLRAETSQLHHHTRCRDIVALIDEKSMAWQVQVFVNHFRRQGQTSLLYGSHITLNPFRSHHGRHYFSRQSSWCVDPNTFIISFGCENQSTELAPQAPLLGQVESIVQLLDRSVSPTSVSCSSQTWVIFCGNGIAEGKIVTHQKKKRETMTEETVVLYPSGQRWKTVPQRLRQVHRPRVLQSL